MALNMEALKSALDRQENPQSGGGGGRNPLRFSLNPGEDEANAVVRIVPYVQIPENPFLELYFHYGLPGQNSILCPRRMEDFPGFVSEFYDCPLCEFGFEILAKYRESGGATNESAKIRYKPYLDALLPKLRTHIPVVVVSENGVDQDPDKAKVQFWGVGNGVYTDILKAAVHLDANGIDITDVKKGVFWDIKTTSKKKTGTNFPKTEVEVHKDGLGPQIAPLFSTAEGNPDNNRISAVLDAQETIFDLYTGTPKSKLNEYLEKFCASNDTEEREQDTGTEKYGKKDDEPIDTTELTSDFSKLLEKDDE